MEKEIKEILKDLSSNFNKKNIEFYKSFKDKTFGDVASIFLEEDCLTPDIYYLFISRKFSSFEKGLISEKIKNSQELIWLYTNYKFIDCAFKKLIQDAEGFACSADKSKYIIECIASFLIDGRKVLDAKKQESEYFKPNKIFNNHEWCMSFFNALHSLYIGNYGVYLKELKSTLLKAELIKKEIKPDH